MMKKIYIASPYTIGDVELNVKKHIETAIELIKLNYIPYAPLLSHYIDSKGSISYEKWLEIDSVWLLSCDAVLRLPGESKGADRETAIALVELIPVFYDIKELQQGLF